MATPDAVDALWSAAFVLIGLAGVNAPARHAAGRARAVDPPGKGRSVRFEPHMHEAFAAA